MAIRKTIGGDRLGSGSKMTTELSHYNRSTHDIGKVTRTSQATGTLVPIYCTFIQKGDVLDIDLEALIRTHPTNGPIFGTYKLQVDVFTADVRLYNKQLHNNTTAVGLKMNEIIFPQMVLNGKNPIQVLGDLNQQQIAPDSLLAYLGVRGLGTRSTLDSEGAERRVEIRRNATPMLMYYEIVKEYYANKQEEVGYVIGADVELQGAEPVFGEFHSVVVNTNVTTNTLPNEGTSAGQLTISNQGLARQKVRLTGNGLYPFSVQLRHITTVNNNDQQTQSYDVLLEEIPGVERVSYGAEGDWVDVLLREDTVDRYIIWREQKEGETGYKIADWKEAEEEGDFGRYNGIKLVEFPLSNIDDMREKIFAQPKTSALEIGYTGENDVVPYNQVVGQTKVSGGAVQTGSDMLAKFPMCGLALKTYQSDRYNNWLSKEWVDHINDISSVDVGSGSFTMDALNLAKKVYKLENDIAISGNTYQDWLEAVYGEKTSGAAEMPVYRGGMSAEIIFEEVISSSDATTAGGVDQPLGTLGGRGAERMKKGGKIRVRAEEHGYLMIIASLTPRIDYHQGNQWWTKLETMDDIHKPMLDSIGFQDLLTDEMAAWDTTVNDDGTETFYSAGKQPSWTHYMTNTNEVFGNFARENAEQWMVLTRRYEVDGGQGHINDITTYIDPSKFNYPFAYTGLDNQPFWCQYGIEVINRRIMSANQMPNL